MQQYNFPTTIYCGQGSLDALVSTLKEQAHSKALIVTDPSLQKIGLVDRLTSRLDKAAIPFSVFAGTNPNPTEDDVLRGTAAYKKAGCDSIIAFGGGSPMDAAKTIKIMAVHPGPLSRYDDAKGGSRHVTEPMPPLYAIPTTAGTGSEVGRSAVIIMPESSKKTIFFHPSLMPDIAVLEPELTTGLPAHITAATGIDAFVHSLEAYFAPGLHPMADGIALEGMNLVLRWLPVAYLDEADLDARERMLLAATMGATAFQKGLGMIHSLAHPLSSRCGIHHGLANALLLPVGMRFLEKAELNEEQKGRLARVNTMFGECGFDNALLSGNCEEFARHLGIAMGLSAHGVSESDLASLADDAFDDPCHSGNMVPVTRDDLLSVYRAAL